MVGKIKSSDNVRRWLKYMRQLKTWQLIIILLIGVVVAATLLRLNSLGMAERRTAVIQADEKGDKEEIRKTIVDLQRYTSQHMNTAMSGGFFLTKTYERDRDAALQASTSSQNPNSSVYQQASIDCRSRFQGGRESFRNDYVTCVIERVSALSPQGEQASLNLPDPDAYRVSFSSPVWTPDLAGLAVAFCVLITGVIFARLLLLVVLRAMLHRRYRST